MQNFLPYVVIYIFIVIWQTQPRAHSPEKRQDTEMVVAEEKSKATPSTLQEQDVEEVLGSIYLSFPYRAQIKAKPKRKESSQSTWVGENPG